jgi:DNA-binding SARP family transcriptional activator
MTVWCDTPFAGLRAAWLEPFVAAWLDRRQVVLEDRIEADLACGRYRDLLAELAGLVALYPLRETLRAHHMTALACSGQVVEALATFDAARRALAEELGVGPGSRLRELHRQLLRANLTRPDGNLTPTPIRHRPDGRSGRCPRSCRPMCSDSSARADKLS